MKMIAAAAVAALLVAVPGATAVRARSRPSRQLVRWLVSRDGQPRAARAPRLTRARAALLGRPTSPAAR
jgi:hypothetical protein